MLRTTFGGTVLFLLLGSIAFAQNSTNYRLEEYSFNAGGMPSDGSDLTSTSFRMTLGAIGDMVAASGLSSASYQMDVGFNAAYPPPGEVTRQIFVSRTDLEWSAEPAAGVYHLYRDTISNLAGLGFGLCEQQDLALTSATDTDPVPSSDGYFYLVTVQNRLGEEGTKGFQADMTERLGAVCP